MRMKVTHLDNSEAGNITLSDSIFGLTPRRDILARMVNWQLAKRRAGTHKVKGRSEINGSGRKISRQKGGGRARHGNDKAPQFRGGGVAHGPHVRDHAHDLTRKFRALALKHALSAKAEAGELSIVEKIELDAPKTKDLVAKLKGMGMESALFVGGDTLEANFQLAARNIPRVDVIPGQGLNVYDILRRDRLVLSRAAVAMIEERFQ